MLKRIKKNNNEGFTIIEVMIVLAIAALILLIVFLAVPALQRSSRNTQRSTDATNLGAAYSEFVNNNGGTVPTTDTGILADWKPGFYTAAEVTYSYSATVLATVPTPTASANAIYVYTGLTCSSSTVPALATTTGATSTAIIYWLENGSSLQEQCVTAN